MERNPSVPDAVVIDQDDQTQIHVQPATQGGRRHLDIRIWRHGPSGFAPSRAGLALEGPDLDALRQGIAELLEASDGGTHVARVVWDGEDGRRLRAEIEPFGARHVARFAFWQRVRDTWKPVDDGLVLASDLLGRLQGVLVCFHPWITHGNDESARQVDGGQVLYGQALDRWPLPGADWLTLEPDRVAFHPRGVRITCSVTEQEERHAIVLRQWKRDESLWLPEAVSCALAAFDLDHLLSRLTSLAGKYESGEASAEEEVCTAGGSALKVGFYSNESGVMLRLDERRPDGAGHEPRLVLPAVYIPRFGRALAQSWSLLLARLSDAEKSQLKLHQEKSAPETSDGPLASTQPPQAEAETVDESAGAAPVAPRFTLGAEPAAPASEGYGRDVSLQPSANGQASSEDPEAPAEEPRQTILPRLAPRPVRFGQESETPGAIIPDEGEIRIVVEGYLLPRSITMQLDAAADALTGLEQLEALRRQRGAPREAPILAPILFCDHPDCAVYGRLGTRTRPDGIELRVWTGPSTSEAITFEAQYLPDLIEGLRQTLLASGRSVPVSGRFGPADTAGPAGAPPRAAHSDRTAAPDLFGQASASTAVYPAAEGISPRSISLGTIELGHHHVSLDLRGGLVAEGLVEEGPQWVPGALPRPTVGEAASRLALQWDGHALELPVDHLEELLSDIRGLYYDALRGRRGHALTVGKHPAVTISVHNQGPQMCVLFQHEIDGQTTSLAVPAEEVPAFLNALRTALVSHE